MPLPVIFEQAGGQSSVLFQDSMMKCVPMCMGRTGSERIALHEGQAGSECRNCVKPAALLGASQLKSGGKQARLRHACFQTSQAGGRESGGTMCAHRRLKVSAVFN